MSIKEYTIRQELISKFSNAFAHPARVAICQVLCENDGLYFGEIQEKLPLSKATVSQHIAVLKDTGLIISEDFPPRVKYSIEK
ncbi:MAG: helix-turn-helix transcriptional regulator, partial [Bacteroidales bacterium]|nr:helix-turn-helix transcriptional regulator [Bacteroidales bacterium]